uniref:Venom protein n=1 Tax=Tityus obscurus TaxID=1221240 RepID=A0A1E1WVN8_TITOB
MEGTLWIILPCLMFMMVNGNDSFIDKYCAHIDAVKFFDCLYNTATKETVSKFKKCASEQNIPIDSKERRDFICDRNNADKLRLGYTCLFEIMNSDEIIDFHKTVDICMKQ